MLIIWLSCSLGGKKNFQFFFKKAFSLHISFNHLLEKVATFVGYLWISIKISSLRIGGRIFTDYCNGISMPWTVTSNGATWANMSCTQNSHTDYSEKSHRRKEWINYRWLLKTYDLIREILGLSLQFKSLIISNKVYSSHATSALSLCRFSETLWWGSYPSPCSPNS